MLARLEVIREALEHRKDNAEILQKDEEAPNHDQILVANAGYTSTENSFDPWKRTVSQMSMSSMMEPDMSSCRVQVAAGQDTAGPFYDRHRTYLVSISSQEGSRLVRRYKDFEWLRQTLVHKYPFRIIPQIPPKKLSRKPSVMLRLNFVQSDLFRTISGVSPTRTGGVSLSNCQSSCAPKRSIIG